ncbi:MAG TPA: AMP-dependent synthetase, partial [Acidimicrobiaceae bacterium]|nr:AMP-dependent synthetase [Acidimicrobiaceae bacterium]
AAVVGMNAWWTTAEMKFGLTDCGAGALVCDAERLERVEPLLEGLRGAGPLHVVAVRAEGDLPDDAVHWE